MKKFSLKSVFFGIAASGVLLGWYIDRSSLKRQTMELNRECAELFRSQNVLSHEHFQNGTRVDYGPRGFQASATPLFLGSYDAFAPEDRARFKTEHFSDVGTGVSGLFERAIK